MVSRTRALMVSAISGFLTYAGYITFSNIFQPQTGGLLLGGGIFLSAYLGMVSGNNGGY